MLITQIMKCDMIAKEAQNETNHVINKKHTKFFFCTIPKRLNEVDSSNQVHHIPFNNKKIPYRAVAIEGLDNHTVDTHASLRWNAAVLLCCLTIAV